LFYSLYLYYMTGINVLIESLLEIWLCVIDKCYCILVQFVL